MFPQMVTPGLQWTCSLNHLTTMNESATIGSIEPAPKTRVRRFATPSREQVPTELLTSQQAAPIVSERSLAIHANPRPRPMRDKRPTRDKIHQAALHLFVTQGISETSVRDLAQAAGIAEGTLYRHYPSKDDLIAGLFLLHYRTFADALRNRQAALPKTTPLDQRLGDLFTQVFTFHDQDPTLFRFLMLVQHNALPQVADGPDNPVSLLGDLLTQGVDDGSLPGQDPALMVAIVLGLLLQPASAVLYGRLKGPLLPLAEPLAQACLRALRPPSTTTGSAQWKKP